MKSFRSLIGGLLILGSILIVPGSALAFNQRITVYASVPEMRVIFVDKSDNITKIEGNTTNNITPEVYDGQNHPVAFSDSIKSQYELFMQQHGWHLQASKIYEVNPVVVNSQPNSQSIKIDTSDLSLGGQGIH